MMTPLTRARISLSFDVSAIGVVNITIIVIITVPAVLRYLIFSLLLFHFIFYLSLFHAHIRFPPHTSLFVNARSLRLYGGIKID